MPIWFQVALSIVVFMGALNLLIIIGAEMEDMVSGWWVFVGWVLFVCVMATTGGLITWIWS